MQDRFSLHSLMNGERLMQKVKREDFRGLTEIAFATRYLPPLKDVIFLG